MWPIWKVWKSHAKGNLIQESKSENDNVSSVYLVIRFKFVYQLINRNTLENKKQYEFKYAFHCSTKQ